MASPEPAPDRAAKLARLTSALEALAAQSAADQAIQQAESVAAVEAVLGLSRLRRPHESDAFDHTLAVLRDYHAEGLLGERADAIARSAYLNAFSHSAAAGWGDPPKPVLYAKNEADVEPLLAEGMAAVISGPDDGGKTALATQLALAAAAGAPAGAGLVSLGLSINPGAAVIANNDASGAEMAANLRAERERWALPERALDEVRVIGSDDLNVPLWRGPEAPEEERGPTAAMEKLAVICADTEPRLLVIDPLSWALTDAAHNDWGTVRAFVHTLTRLAPEGVVALITPQRDREQLWRDAARLALDLQTESNGVRSLTVTKTSYGRTRLGGL